MEGNSKPPAPVASTAPRRLMMVPKGGGPPQPVSEERMAQIQAAMQARLSAGSGPQHPPLPAFPTARGEVQPIERLPQDNTGKFTSTTLRKVEHVPYAPNKASGSEYYGPSSNKYGDGHYGPGNTSYRGASEDLKPRHGKYGEAGGGGDNSDNRRFQYKTDDRYGPGSSKDNDRERDRDINRNRSRGADICSGSRFDSRGEGGFSRPSGRGAQTNMGEVDAVKRLMKENSMSLDKIALSIVDPPLEQRFRDDIMVQNDSKKWMPQLQSWRVAQPPGIRLDNTNHIIRSNFFKLNPQLLPDAIYQYNVGIFKYDRNGNIVPEDLSKELDRAVNTAILKELLDAHNEWKVVNKKDVGYAFDGKSSMYTSAQLQFLKDSKVLDMFQEDVYFPRHSLSKYHVVISQVLVIHPPKTNNDWTKCTDQSVLQALDIALLSFARWSDGNQNAKWFINGTTIYKSGDLPIPLIPGYCARMGYTAALRSCMSGPCLMSEISVNCFLVGGSLLELMATIGKFRSVEDMARACDPERGLPNDAMRQIEKIFKNARIRLIHLGHSKKLKGFGPAANHRDSRFQLDDGSSITVAEYYEQQGRTNPVYGKYLSNGRLRYPLLPLVQVGSKNRPVYIPVEFVEVIAGQLRKGETSAEICSLLIKHAALLPNDRFLALTSKSADSGLLNEITTDPNLQAFGLSNVDSQPMKVQGYILPPPKLQYGNRVIDPQLSGTWNLAGGTSFAHPASRLSQHRDQSEIPYAIVIAFQRNRPYKFEQDVEKFQQMLETESRILGTPLKLCMKFELIDTSSRDCERSFHAIQKRGAKLAVVLLVTDVYASIKLVADAIVLPTQCVRWKNLLKPPRQYCTSLMVKINGKLGGVNHTLASRAPEREQSMLSEDSFQFPPKSISWLFEEPCMLLGVDVNHPTQSAASSVPSVAAVVGSMDGMLGQYCAHISTCTAREEPVTNLHRAVSALLDAFCARNGGNMPKRIIIYRDGISDNQFNEVLEKELVAYKDALMLRGYNEDSVQIAIVMCQKRHHTRLVYQSGSSSEFLNTCTGMCVDGRTALGVDPNFAASSDGIGSINAPGLNEFYLNSHAPVLGTSKPCKYVLIYDEIGLALSELELLTYWTTHLYQRCTRAVSYATPAYYAHWAARRGKALLSAGASVNEVVEISERWLSADAAPSLYFI